MFAQHPLTAQSLLMAVPMNGSRFLIIPTIVASLLPSCSSEVLPDYPTIEQSEVVRKIAGHIAPLVQMESESRRLSTGLFDIPKTQSKVPVTLETCMALETSLQNYCVEYTNREEAQYCTARTTYFSAYDRGYCSARLTHLDNERTTEYAFDLVGDMSEEVPHCGNGVVDEEFGESCDDGNREDWDGCSAICQEEEFQGCEAVIESYYRQQGLVQIDQTQWHSPRSHMMIHSQPTPLAEVNSDNCNAVISMGSDICHELVDQMPFVSNCQPLGSFSQEEGRNTCQVQLRVDFGQVDWKNGVFTTALPGILAFEISSDSQE